MYVALIGLQFIERIYIGPNEDVVMGKLAAWKRTLVPWPHLKSIMFNVLSMGFDGFPLFFFMFFQWFLLFVPPC